MSDENSKGTQVIAYTRVSSEKQAESGLGLEAQRTAIQRAVLAQGWTVAHWFEDAGISGADEISQRPGLFEAIAALGEGSVLCVAKLDRLSRSSPLGWWIEKEVARKGARLVSAAGEGTDDDSPAGQLMRTIITAFAHFERQVISARTQAALAAARQRGTVGGQAPYGYVRDGKGFRPVPDEVAHVRQFIDWRRAGLSWAQTQAAAENLTGRRWHVNTLRRLVKRGVKSVEGAADEGTKESQPCDTSSAAS